MEDLQWLASLLDLYQLTLTIILVLHALSLAPQWQRHYFNPRLLRVAMLGMMLGIAQGAVIVAAVEVSAIARGGGVAMLGAAILMHGWVALQNLLASYAFVHLHRPSALMAHRMAWAQRPLGYLSAALTLIAGFTLS
ncbi:hypothetical protein GTP41_14590 [Pseudoduganella sp. DS3]|uniref:DUF2214 family protein n=1 Tax=Pseudoduganella guangdongensis TaxID=2692179 RepID=A0A6N9HI73_9BURK|nr:hypothetical protein [Pseudoduganella guangdongensis]MYN03321.1 hypothetical protein [Pseudoduganella guangdongensis]